MAVKTRIDTAYGRKTIIRRVGVAGEYYFEAPGPSAPNGGWWTLNPQRGFVPVASNSRALMGGAARGIGKAPASPSERETHGKKTYR